MSTSPSRTSRSLDSNLSLNNSKSTSRSPSSPKTSPPIQGQDSTEGQSRFFILPLDNNGAIQRSQSETNISSRWLDAKQKDSSMRGGAIQRSKSEPNIKSRWLDYNGINYFPVKPNDHPDNIRKRILPYQSPQSEPIIRPLETPKKSPRNGCLSFLKFFLPNWLKVTCGVGAMFLRPAAPREIKLSFFKKITYTATIFFTSTKVWATAAICTLYYGVHIALSASIGLVAVPFLIIDKLFDYIDKFFEMNGIKGVKTMARGALLIVLGLKSAAIASAVGSAFGTVVGVKIFAAAFVSLCALIPGPGWFVLIGVGVAFALYGLFRAFIAPSDLDFGLEKSRRRTQSGQGNSIDKLIYFITFPAYLRAEIIDHCFNPST